MSTPLKVSDPELASEWHPEKNGELTPDDVTPSSSKKVWRRCREDPTHEWKTAICDRARGGHGCPMCSGRVATPTTSLRFLRPDLAAEWHTEKNGELTPENVVPGSGKRVWWRCRVDPSHEWKARIINRMLGSTCPKCKSLLALCSDLAAEWHPEKNGELTPDKV